MKLINDFLDYNYENIAFDIAGVDKDDIKQKLLKDHVNHLYELDDARYIAMAKLAKRDGELLYDIIDNQARVLEDYQLM